MRAGTLSEEIIIERNFVTKNQFGEEDNEWRKHLETRADVQYNSGARAVQQSEMVFNYSITFNVRIYHDIIELDRVVWNGKYYRILEIEDNKRFQIKRLRCELINE